MAKLHKEIAYSLFEYGNNSSPYCIWIGDLTQNNSEKTCGLNILQCFRWVTNWSLTYWRDLL